MSPTVWVSQDDGRLDLSDAARFGELRPLFHRDIYPDNVDDQAPLVMARLRAELAEFDFERDYLCLVGSLLYATAAGLVLAQYRPPGAALRVLRYDRGERRYYDATLE